MIDRRAKNVAIFEDTKNRYHTEPELVQVIDNSLSNQYFTDENEEIQIPVPMKRDMARIVVSGKRSLEAAEYYAKQGKKVCVLNFASATNPGGGVRFGSSAQEEAICRCTTLYPCLDSEKMWNCFYIPHRNVDNPLYNDDSIYTPDVCVIKSDANFPELLKKEDWWKVNVITCAAPNLRERPSNSMNPHSGSKAAAIKEEDLRKLLQSRIKRIFELAIKENNEVLILGAFGCGAFCNPPGLVASVFAEMTKRYGMYFETIEYAVFHTEREKGNFEAFREVFG